MPSPYVVVVVHRDLANFASEVREAVREATAAVLHQPGLVGFSDDLAGVDPDAHIAVVYLGSKAGSQDADVRALVAEALDQQFPIMPLVRSSESGGVTEKLPPELERVNAADWEDQRDLALATLLGMLGLGELERKVFISYLRRESTPVANQLHTELARIQFDVFLDRFAIPPGEDFQRRLDEDLGDMAFMLLLESRELHTSQWVQHEIAYALSHRIGVLVLTLPDVTDAELVPSIDDAFRVRLEAGDLTDAGELVPEKLRYVLHQVELAHARALRGRREQLLGSLRDKLLLDGCICELLGDWAVIATAPGRKASVFLVTPRRPRPEDFYDLHLLHDKTASDSEHELSAMLVHEVEQMDERQRNVLEWIAEPWRYRSTLLHDCVLAVEDAA